MKEDQINIQNTGGLRPECKSYERQKCFVGHSTEAAWCDDLLSACAEVLPKFDLEPWYAANHFDPTKPLRDKVVQLIANARYAIYDLSSWQDKGGEWHQPRNVFIELGMAIALNRPALLLRHTSNKAIPLPECLRGLNLIEFTGDYTLKKALKEHLPHWLNVPPERDWLNRFCIFGNRVCNFREKHPRSQQWGNQVLCCHITDGLDKVHPEFEMAEREEVLGAFEEVFSRYGDLTFNHLDGLSITEGYQFLLCSYCQTVRSTPFAIYRLSSHTPAEVFIAIGMNIALETLFEYDIPKIILVRSEQELPSLLRGYEVIEAINSSVVKKKLRKLLPSLIQNARHTAWKPRPLPFIEFASQPDPKLQEGVSEKSFERENLAKATILFADNNLVFLRVRKEFLERNGYKVIEATSPAQARNLLLSEQIDLAILDFRLTDDNDGKDRSGLDLAKEEAFIEIPKIIISGFLTTKNAVEAAKPVNGIVAVRDIIDKKKGPEFMLQIISENLAQMEEEKNLRASMLPLVINFEKALRDLVDQVFQSKYEREWATQLNIDQDSRHLSLDRLLNLIRDQRDQFEPLFATSETYGTLVTTAKEINTIRNAVVHAEPGIDITEMQQVKDLVEKLLPAILEAQAAASVDASEIRTDSLSVTDKERCQTVIDNLSPHEFKILQIFATGLSPQEVAKEMGLALKTVNTYRRNIFDQCRAVWPDRTTLRYDRLQELFGPFFEQGTHDQIIERLHNEDKDRILVVEDDPDIAKMLRIYFMGQDYEVHVALRGEEALELCRSQVPDIIVLDYTLPDIDGAEVHRRLQTDGRTRDIPTILLTYRENLNDTIAIPESGVVDYLSKPFDIEQLKSRVDNLLARFRTEQNMNAK